MSDIATIELWLLFASLSAPAVFHSMDSGASGATFTEKDSITLRARGGGGAAAHEDTAGLWKKRD